MVEGAEGVMTKGSMCLAVLEWGLLPVSVALGLLLGDWGFKGIAVIVEVPCWRGKVPVEGRRVEGVVAAGLVGGGSQDGGCSSC